jgi:hypothetical protein
MPTFEEELNALGGGGPSFDDELAALGGGAPPRQLPDDRKWYNKPWDEALGEAVPGALDALRGAAVGITGAFGANSGDTPQAMESAKRSPSLFGGAKLGSEVLGQAAVLPVGEIGGLASGALGGALSGYGNTSGDLTHKLQGAEEGSLWGAAGGRAGELVGNVASKVGGFAEDTVAPWLRDQGLLNRAASTGKPMGALSKEFGGRQGVIDAGQFMEDNGMTSWSPKKLQSDLGDYASMRQGDQSYFLDDLAKEGGAPVNTGNVSEDLFSRAGSNEGLAAQNAQQQSGQYLNAASLLDREASDGMMQFPQALQQRQAFDQGAKWNLGPNGDQGLAAVNRDAANGLRGEMGTALDNTAPGLRQKWEPIQSDLSNAIGLSGGDDAALGREFSGTPSPMKFGPMAAAATSGPVGYTATLAAQTGGRGMLADALKGGSQALDWLGSQGDNVAGGMQAVGRESGEAFSNTHNSRGYLLPQAAQQLMSQSPQELGPYQQQFFDTYKDPDANALSQLIVRLSHTDPQFKTTILPKLQQLTAQGY